MRNRQRIGAIIYLCLCICICIEISRLMYDGGPCLIIDVHVNISEFLVFSSLNSTDIVKDENNRER